jgi:hypothetical protein
MRVRVDAKVLEDKVAQAASKKCSFEEVSALHKEVQDWLSHDPHKKGDPQVCNNVFDSWMTKLMKIEWCSMRH